ncbi:MAG: glutaredoxin domain-containing protein [Actinomycetota bacterium]|nr:glutaredoxin domain-containing protein [Actinomycetota bacterium]
MSETEATTGDGVVEFYWRPGCGFCAALERNLTKLGLPFEKHDIWSDPDAAAFVRSVADGNETVPTVRVGDTSMVNPRPGQVVDAVRQHLPHLLPADAGV